MRSRRGSVAKAVVRNAPCSVEIVRRAEHADREPKLLAAVDGSVFSQSAARALASRPWPAGSVARIVSVAQTGVYAGFYWVTYSQAQEIDDLRRRAAGLLLGSVSEAVATHASCSVEVVRERRDLRDSG